MIRQALAVAFKNLIFWFDGKYICQKNGITIGVAASPNVTNIYAGIHEESILLPRILEASPYQDHIAFYG